MYKILSGFVVLVLFLAIGFVPSYGNATQNSHLEGQILVKFKDSTDKKSAENALKANSAKIKKELAGLGVLVITVPEGKEAKIAENLSNNPNVEYAEVDSLVSASSTDTFFENQWGLENTAQTIVGQRGNADADIDAPEAWDITTGAGIKVAILDSGIDNDHEDISSKVVLSHNFSTSPDTNDIYGHGTHVAGIVAASKDNSVGVAGVCPGCVIMNGKVLKDDGYGAVSWAVDGITWATDNGAQVINMSIGFRKSSKTMDAAVKYAWDRNVVLVASAGNGGSQAKEYPGAYTNVIAVAATDNRDQKASFSTYGARWVDIAAPGVNVYSTFPNHPFTIQNLYGRSMNYDFANGTSMSSPMVAGVAALVWTTPHGTSNSAVRNRVEATAERIPGTGTYWSAGRVNAYSAVSP